MSLTNVWLQSLGDGLVRADQVIGIDSHETPELAGKPTRWLLDAVLAIPTGSGTRSDWGVGILHRTLAQTPHRPGTAPEDLARLLAQLDLVSAAGIVTITRDPTQPGAAPGEAAEPSSTLRLRFTPFASPEPGHHTAGEYL